MYSDLTVCSIASGRFLPQARTMVASFLEAHPGANAVVLELDPRDGDAATREEPFETVPLDELIAEHPWIHQLAFQYNEFELCSALKPHVIEYVFSRTPAQRVVYLDSDVWVTAPFEPAWSVLAASSLVLTPHLLRPVRHESHPALLHLLTRGVYNSGFLALSRCDDARHFVSWWRERLRRHCIGLPKDRNSGDQKWIDLVPGMFEGVSILRDAGFNVAHWNLEERHISIDDDAILVNGKRACFFHFSGFRPDTPDAALLHRPDLIPEDTVAFSRLAARYASAVAANTGPALPATRYRFANFDNGVAIPDFVRKRYQELGDSAALFGNPFDSGNDDSFYSWLVEPVDEEKPTLSRFVCALQVARPEVRTQFPRILGRDRFRFARWLADRAEEELDLDPSWLDGIRAEMKGRVAYRILTALARLRSR